MTIMLKGKCPKCGEEVIYGAYEYGEPPLCTRCKLIKEYKKE